LKTGVNRGSGPPPGYQWNVWILDRAFREASEFLNEAQYAHLAEQVKALARQSDPTHSDTISLDAIEDFHELRDWGGILYPLNVRIFFGVDKSLRAIVILGVIDKRNNGPTPQGDKIRMRGRWRRYGQGEFK
jgi:hypothetical protein